MNKTISKKTIYTIYYNISYKLTDLEQGVLYINKVENH